MSERSDDVERLVEVLRDERLAGCNCNPLVDGQTCSPCLRDRLLASSWLAAHDAEVAARALREVVDDWTQGQWSDVMLPKPTPPAVPVIAYANRIGDFLRARAYPVARHAHEDDQ